MNGTYPLWGLLVFVVFILVNNVLYGFISAIGNVNESDIEKDEEKYNNKHTNKILAILDNSKVFISNLKSILVMLDIAIGSILIKLVISIVRKMDYIEDKMFAIVAILIVMFVLLEVCGIVVPSKLALKNPKDYIFKHYTMVKVMERMFVPITFIINSIANLMIRILGMDPNSFEDNVTEEEIIDMVNEGHEQGVLLESEAEMINNIFEFGDKQASDVMIHRKNIIAVDGNDTLEKAVTIFFEEGLSRLPVYEDDIDNVVGILHFKDAFKEYQKTEKRKLTVLAFKDMMYDAHLIPETRSINLLFKQMQTEKVHMAIVVDEYGQTEGLVTMEDIIEEIVGNIFDEHDDAYESIKKQSENVYVVDGLAELDELEKLFHIEFDEKDFDTLNGFLISKLERIPEDGETFEITYKNYIFKVLKVEKKMISKVRIIVNDKNTKID